MECITLLTHITPVFCMGNLGALLPPNKTQKNTPQKTHNPLATPKKKKKMFLKLRVSCIMMHVGVRCAWSGRVSEGICMWWRSICEGVMWVRVWCKCLVFSDGVVHVKTFGVSGCGVMCGLRCSVCGVCVRVWWVWGCYVCVMCVWGYGVCEGVGCVNKWCVKV